MVRVGCGIVHKYGGDRTLCLQEVAKFKANCVEAFTTALSKSKSEQD